MEFALMESRGMEICVIHTIRLWLLVTDKPIFPQVDLLTAVGLWAEICCCSTTFTLLVHSWNCMAIDYSWT